MDLYDIDLYELRPNKPNVMTRKPAGDAERTSVSAVPEDRKVSHRDSPPTSRLKKQDDEDLGL